MDAWMSKVNEMKRLRERGGATSVSRGAGRGSARSRGAARGGPRGTSRGSATSSFAARAAALRPGPGGNAASLPRSRPTAQSSSHRPPPPSSSTKPSAEFRSRGQTSPALPVSHSSSANTGATKDSSTLNDVPKLQLEVRRLQRRLEASEAEARKAKEDLAAILKRKEEAKAKMAAKREKMLAVKKASAARRAQAPSMRKAAAKDSMYSSKAGGGGGSNVLSHIGRVLEEMNRLEQAISKAEEGKLRAMNDLITYANERKARDQAVGQLLTQLDVALGISTELQGLSLGDMAAPGKVSALHTALIACQTVSQVPALQEGRATATAGAGAGAGAGASGRRAPPSISISRTAAVPSAPSAPSAPAAPRGAPRAARGRGGGQAGRGGAASLLDMIRQGKELKPVDLEMWKRSRKRKTRQSVMMINSLQDTLRKAVLSRQDDMVGEGDDMYGDDLDDDDVWDDEDVW